MRFKADVCTTATAEAQAGSHGGSLGCWVLGVSSFLPQNDLANFIHLGSQVSQPWKLGGKVLAHLAGDQDLELGWKNCLKHVMCFGGRARAPQASMAAVV